MKLLIIFIDLLNKFLLKLVINQPVPWIGGGNLPKIL